MAATVAVDRAPGLRRPTLPDALSVAVAAWFAVALAGQWAFLYYVASFYGVSTLRGNFAAWHANPALLKGYVPGDLAGNLSFATHVLLAISVTFGGALQAIPQIRSHVPALHRWNGRIFLVTAIGGALSGFYMIWVRGSRANAIAGVATSLDGLLILAFATLAWRAARARDYVRHRRLALRTWMAASAVWFQRVGVFGWIWVNHAPVGMTKQFDGWFDLSWNFGCYLVPLAVLEIYLRVRERAGAGGRVALATVLLLLTALMGVGVFASYAYVWSPVLGRVVL
jgi:hypothetical protein